MICNCKVREGLKLSPKSWSAPRQVKQQRELVPTIHPSQLPPAAITVLMTLLKNLAEVLVKQLPCAKCYLCYSMLSKRLGMTTYWILHDDWDEFLVVSVLNSVPDSLAKS